MRLGKSTTEADRDLADQDIVGDRSGGQIFAVDINVVRSIRSLEESLRRLLRWGNLPRVAYGSPSCSGVNPD